MKKIIFLAILSTLAAPVAAQVVPPIEMDAMKIMTNPNIGNCTACHAIPANDKIVAGDVGPPFIGMKDRFPDIKKLRAAIADQKKISPDTIMPPFERTKILNAAQIDAVTQLVYTY